MISNRCLIIVVVISLSVSFITGSEGVEYPEGIYAKINTSKGMITLSLEFEKTPLTVTNFVGLVEGTIKNEALAKGVPFYDGSSFHRVVPGHVIQGGIPAGSEKDGPGYTFPNEIHPDLGHNQAGMVGIANGGPHTNTCQFYITLGDRSYLDGDYIVFGRVIEGMDVVNQIKKDDQIISIRILRIGERAKKFKTRTKQFYKRRKMVSKRVANHEAEKKKRESEIIKKNYPLAKTTETGLQYLVLREGSGAKPKLNSLLKVTYSGEFLNKSWRFSSSSDKGKPSLSEKPESFTFEVGTSKIIPGVDEALMDMRKGEKRLLILLPGMAYGNSGFYSREKRGTKRFVIPPNTTLLYQVELLDIKNQLQD